MELIIKTGFTVLEMKVNGHKVYHHNLETFSFKESKYINLLIDYPHSSKYKKKYQKTHKVNGNKLNIYKKLLNNGMINIKTGFNYNVEIIVSDYQGNTATLKIPVKGIKSNAIFKQEKDTTHYKIASESSINGVKKVLQLHFQRILFIMIYF